MSLTAVLRCFHFSHIWSVFLKSVNAALPARHPCLFQDLTSASRWHSKSACEKKARQAKGVSGFKGFPEVSCAKQTGRTAQKEISQGSEKWIGKHIS